ncbi:unnamed protein product [Candidula unifasciata]|uniref:C-type lectin domain-containing protein n=1 Tax=Candidula unifasciata TaxID=100452 RepID=A0A8S3YZF1_9EUPU|nr:unnamed protein product [Candidula unifasciata]
MHLQVGICQVLIWLIVLQLVLCREQCCVKLEKKMRRVIKETCSCKRKLECPFGFIRFKGVCYWFIMGDYEVRDWWRARNICRNHGGNLVTVNDKRREVFIHNYLKANFQNIGSPVKIFTGLIYTDDEAENPYVVLHRESSAVGNQVRWSSNKEFVNWPVNVTTPIGNRAKWSPDIQGEVHGPGSQLYLSCVVLIWDPRARSKLTWRFNDCGEKNLTLICEVRLGEPKSARLQTLTLLALQ